MSNQRNQSLNSLVELPIDRGIVQVVVARKRQTETVNSIKQRMDAIPKVSKTNLD